MTLGQFLSPTLHYLSNFPWNSLIYSKGQARIRTPTWPSQKKSIPWHSPSGSLQVLNFYRYLQCECLISEMEHSFFLLRDHFANLRGLWPLSTQLFTNSCSKRKNGFIYYLKVKHKRLPPRLKLGSSSQFFTTIPITRSK